MTQNQNKKIQLLLKKADEDMQSSYLLFCQFLSRNPRIMPYEVRRLEYDLKRKLRMITTDLSNEIQELIKIEMEVPRFEYKQA